MQQISSQICISKFLHLRRHIGKTSICALDVIYLSLHLLRISLYISLIILAYCVNISTYCVYRLSSVPFSAYRFSDLGAYHITRFIRITQILEIYCSILKIYCTCCRVLQKYRILGEKWYQNWGKTGCHPGPSATESVQASLRPPLRPTGDHCAYRVPYSRPASIFPLGPGAPVAALAVSVPLTVLCTPSPLCVCAGRDCPRAGTHRTENQCGVISPGASLNK